MYKVSFLLLIIIFGFYHPFVRAQESVQMNVVYNFCYMRDLADKEYSYKDRMILLLSSQSSRFCSYDLFERNNKAALAKRKKQYEMMSRSPGSGIARTVMGGPMLPTNKFGTIINEEILINRLNKTLRNSGSFGFKTYYYSIPMPVINWSLLHEKKTILGYDCQKAVGEYGGRSYHAWFTTQLPYQAGPWKLTGLPGLILEAYDSKDEVGFRATELTKNTDLEEMTSSYFSDDWAIRVSEKEFKRIRRSFETDPEVIVSAQIPNVKVTIINTDDPNDRSIKKIKQYNPIELK